MNINSLNKIMINSLANEVDGIDKYSKRSSKGPIEENLIIERRIDNEKLGN